MGANASANAEKYQPKSYQAKKVIKAIRNKNEWKLYFNSCKSTNKLVVIDFTATWCGPCRSIEPTLQDFCEKYIDVDFIKLDVDEVSDVAAEYGVQAMPTFLLIKKGEQVDKVVGAKKDILQAKIEKHRNSYSLTY